ncbi:UDP-N-acetylmuramyl-tripeptide synthetase [Patescibacteria group bacterium]|nr:UDP-N-acetylmuramyl-tripeptide synthetase [Patescibacteria group bacterium]
MSKVKEFIRSLLPRSVYRELLAPYHISWAFFSALAYGFPAGKIIVIGVTGTKGKSSVSEMLATILEEAGHAVAISSTIHFKIGEKVRPNLFKMTLPGRGFIQKFLHDAVQAKCTYAVIELTSEGALQYRHLFLSLDALIFTNLEKEHLETHGSMEKYFEAKFRLGHALEHSEKRPRAVVANSTSEYGKRFLVLSVEKQIPFSLNDATGVELSSEGVSFVYENTHVSLPHPGNFSVLNALAAIKTAQFLDISVATSAAALAKLVRIPGRAERIEMQQDFLAIVDYAHTPDSLQALYEAYPDKRKICVLGNTGGGRDTWKRPEMGRIADAACAEVILTNEDPYNEDPRKIVEQMAKGMSRAPRIIMDRREAIHTALSLAKKDDAVLITGKGTDPYIMLADGKKLPWSDARVVREELEKLAR